MNAKSKLNAISIGIAAIIMVSLFATVSVNAGNSPDLRIQDIPEEFVNGQVIVHYRVTNIGDAMADSSDAGVDVNGYRMDTENVPELGPGASYDGTFTLDCTPGATLDVTVCADVYGLVDESDESNNCMTNTFICPPGPLPGGPDLVVEKTVEFVDGQFVVHYKVTNIGGEEASASKICKLVNGVCAEVETVPALGPGGSFCDNFNLEPCPPGETINVTVCADCTHVVGESDETNNCEINIVTCPGVDMPDLVVEKTVEKRVVPGGDPTKECEYRVSYTITNIGTATAGASKVVIIVDGVLLQKKLCNVLKPGLSVKGDFGWYNCPCGDGLINVTVCADYTEVVTESNETNNCVANILVVQSTHVVIQAFDQNPAGYPTAEWVMLYNPTNESVNISGWSISSIKYRGGRSFTIIKNISIAARNYLTFVPGKQWLHDEDESVILKDAAGNIVDKIVNASDGDADNRYWKRFDSDWQFGLQTLDTGGMRRGTVKYVYDGDTIHISPLCAKATEFITYNITEEGKIYISPVAMAGIQSVRLDGIDAPELKTEEGNISMKFLDDLCSGREVVFDVDDGRQYDKYNRVLAMVFCANGTNVNQEMLRNGSAIPLIILPSEFVPYANYTYRPLNPVVNQRIKFNASSSWTFDPEAAIVSYEWCFGDGTNGTGELTNHSFHSPGNYTVSLEVTDSDGEERRCNARDMTIRICSKNP